MKLSTQRISRLAIATIAALSLSGWRVRRFELARAEAAVPATLASSFAPIGRPERCREIPAGASLNDVIQSSADGDALCLSNRVYVGPIVIRHAITLWGSHQSVIRSTGQGTTIRVMSPGVRLQGFMVDGSGGRYDLDDAAVDVEANDVTVEGLRIQRSVYGVLAQRAQRVVIRRNVIAGSNEATIGLRGDGIRIWETTDSRIEENDVHGCRDLVVWYSSRNVVSRNRVDGGRYGTHLMYSHHNRIEGNEYTNDVVGIFVMYSHEVEIEHNLIANAAGAAGIGLGLKDSGNITARGNVFVHDTVGTYIDGTPASNDQSDLFEHNVYRLSQTAVTFHSSQRGNRFLRNSFRDNDLSVAVEGGGDALETTWDANDFDDYQGYDMDGDGVGDVPYELRSLSSELTSRYASLELFHGSPALALVDIASHVAPLIETRSILVDRHPRMEPLAPEFSHAH